MAKHNSRGGPYTCPDCGSSNICVQDTLGVFGSRRLIRKRKCKDCGCRWRTAEIDMDDVRELDECARIIGEIKKKTMEAKDVEARS